MQKLAKALSTEISRLARIEATKALAPLKAEIAQLKKLVPQQGKPTNASGRRSPTGKTRGSKTNGSTASSARLTPKAIRAHRERLGLTQADFALLTGVTPVAVYFWESGRTKPGPKSVEVLSGIRKLGVKAAQRRVERLERG